MNVAARLENLREYCRENNIPLTQQRLEVFRELIWSDGHPSPEEIHRSLREKFPTISLATVYNNLEALSKMGFARRINPLSDHARYDSDLTFHSHFICISCKTVIDVHHGDGNSIEIPDPEGLEHEIIGKRIEYTGICSKCKKNSESDK